MKLLRIYHVHVPGREAEYYADESDALLAGKGNGEWGSDCSVSPCDAVATDRGVFLLGSKVSVRDTRDPAERDRVLAKLTPYDRKLLGL